MTEGCFASVERVTRHPAPGAAGRPQVPIWEPYRKQELFLLAAVPVVRALATYDIHALTVETTLPQSPGNPAAAFLDTISFPGENGSLRKVFVAHQPMDQVMAPGQSVKEVMNLFPGIAACASGVNSAGSSCNSTTPIEPTVISKVTLANGQSYSLLYDSYANVRELHLPTGGFYRYSYGSNLYTVCSNGNTGVCEYTIVPYLTEKDVYLNATDPTPAQVIKYSQSSDGSGLSGHVVYQDGYNNVLGMEDHTFVPMGLGPGFLPVGYNGWSEGKELSANYYAPGGGPPSVRRPPPGSSGRAAGPRTIAGS